MAILYYDLKPIVVGYLEPSSSEPCCGSSTWLLLLVLASATRGNAPKLSRPAIEKLS
jgi:hypothetical protein